MIDREIIEKGLREYLDSDVKFILEVGGYILDGGGKRVRPTLVLTFAKVISGEIPENAYPLAYAMEYLHTASLLHDDVVDGSLTRRGKPTANRVFGNDACVLTGDYMYALALYLFSIYGNIDMIRNVSNAVKKMAEGQLLELKKIGDLNTTVEDYFKIIKGKTAVLFGSCCYVGASTVSDDIQIKEKSYRFGLNIGLAFQIVDDILDYVGSVDKVGKTTLNDLREGKLTYPLLVILDKITAEERDLINRVIKDKSPPEEDLLRVKNIVLKYRGIDIAVKKARELVEIAKDSIKDFPDTLEKGKLLQLADYIINREL
ncbi:MAG: polyprenyl synthetase family protein [Hydrogenothermaceae bacterium]